MRGVASLFTFNFSLLFRVVLARNVRQLLIVVLPLSIFLYCFSIQGLALCSSQPTKSFNFSLLFPVFTLNPEDTGGQHLSIFLYCFNGSNDRRTAQAVRILSIFLYCFGAYVQQANGDVSLLSIFLYCFTYYYSAGCLYCFQLTFNFSLLFRRLSEATDEELAEIFQFFSIVSLQKPRFYDGIVVGFQFFSIVSIYWCFWNRGGKL